MAFLTAGMRPAWFAGLILLAAWPLIFSSSYDLRVLTLAGVFALLALGYQFVFGHAGALALTQGTFFGVGAYVTGLLSIKLGWTFAWTLPLSILTPLALALLVAAPVLRLESHYFALATLGIGQVMLLLVITWEPMTGGANGLPGVPGVIVFGEPVVRGYPLLFFVWGMVALGAALAWQVMRGLRGLAFTIMRENPVAAMSLGVDVWKLRFGAFLVSAAYAGIAGALYVHTLRVISPEVLEFHVMVAVLTMVVVGGRTRIAGAILGAVLLVHLPEWFRFLDKYYLIAYGGVLLAMIIVAPYGLVGAAERLRARWFPEEAPPSPLPRLPPKSAAHPHSATLLEIEHLSMAFGGVRALDDVSLTLARGEIMGLIGPNGSGKTTFVNCITAIYAPTRGCVRFRGVDITRKAPYEVARLGIARTFQNINLVDEMSVLDSVAVAMHSVRLSDAQAYAMHYLGLMDVAHVAAQPCGSLPYGLKRRVEIARALALEPQLLLLDEPAAGLNDVEQADLALRLRRLAGGQLTLLVIEHNMPFLMPLATRMACLDYGRLIATGTPAAIRADAKVIEAYLGVSQ